MECKNLKTLSRRWKEALVWALEEHATQVALTYNFRMRTGANSPFWATLVSNTDRLFKASLSGRFRISPFSALQHMSWITSLSHIEPPKTPSSSFNTLGSVACRRSLGAGANARLTQQHSLYFLQMLLTSFSSLDNHLCNHGTAQFDVRYMMTPFSSLNSVWGSCEATSKTGNLVSVSLCLLISITFQSLLHFVIAPLNLWTLRF
jgi:hypothetical protein